MFLAAALVWIIPIEASDAITKTTAIRDATPALVVVFCDERTMLVTEKQHGV